MKNFNKSEKLLIWTTRDAVKNAVVYVVNFFILIAMAVSFIFITDGGEDFIYTLGGIDSILYFLLFLAITVIVFFVYFFFEDRDFLKNPGNSEMLFFILEISFTICFFTGYYGNFFLRPFAIPPLLVLFLVNRRTSIFTSMIFCVLVFLMDNFSGQDWTVAYASVFIAFSSGMIAAFLSNKDCSRLKLLCLSFLFSVPALLCALLYIHKSNGLNTAENLVLSAISGPLAAVAFLVLLPFIETMFKRVSCFKLAELTDHKSKLIRRLIKEAPGTFNHSIVVSNIAEACATSIDEDALLARTCAYYHDIGKLRRPEFFSENQSDGVSLHDELMPELSANIIKSHVQDGYQLVLKNRLPHIIADVCLEHHGTMPIFYFYEKAKKFTDGKVDVAEYCYAGPKPQTKIAAIIMIADGCEAASRTLKNRSRENVLSLVRKIVNDRMELGQFDECEITIKELNIIIHTVVNNLTGIYHSRVEYPKTRLNGMDFKKDE